MSETLHVIMGTGPVGCWIARALRTMGEAVRAVNRSGKRPELMPEDVEIVAADVMDYQQAVEAAHGATVIYQALHPAYHRWQEEFPALQAGALAAARAWGARYVSIENLYMYDASEPITEETPERPRSRKGKLRAEMAKEVMETHRRGEIRATALRSSDYYGPGVLNAVLGKRVFGRLVAGKKARLSGSAEMRHSWAYIEDVGRAAAVLGTHDDALGKVWIAPHAPALTQREMVELASRVLGVRPRYTVISPLMMRLVGLFMPEARAFVEVMYQFTEPFVVVSKRVQERFGLEPTPVEVGIARTIKWYTERLGRG